MSRKPFIAGNWKLNNTIAESEELIQGLLPRVGAVEDVEIVVAPQFLALQAVVDSARGSAVQVYAQNMHDKDSGAFTGEVSAPMLVEVGASIAEIGHSERRELFGETDQTVRAKVVAAQRHGITPLVCVGEPHSVRESGGAAGFVEAQVRAALGDANPEAELWLAYEPVWAIGDQGRPATPEQAEEMHALIRATAVDVLGTAAADLPVLYGGSVTADNAAGFLSAPSVSGLFVGRAAWSVDGLLAVASWAARSVDAE
jgi:triosephosphate isomerase (TIM)